MDQQQIIRVSASAVPRPMTLAQLIAWEATPPERTEHMALMTALRAADTEKAVVRVREWMMQNGQDWLAINTLYSQSQTSAEVAKKVIQAMSDDGLLETCKGTKKPDGTISTLTERFTYWRLK